MKRFGRPSLKKFSRDEKIHFCINIGIGIAVVVLLQFFKNTNFGEHAHNKAFDYIIAKEAAEAAASGNIVIQKTKRVAERVAFVDRGKTYKKRGSPLITPREKPRSSCWTFYSKTRTAVIRNMKHLTETL